MGENGGTDVSCLESKISYSCTGKDPLNSVLCDKDDQGLTADVPKTLVDKCTDKNKCEYICDKGYIYKEGKCEKKYIIRS